MSRLIFGGPQRLLRILKENVRFAFLAIAGNRLRALLTVLGIVVGVMAVITMVGIVEGFQTDVAESVAAFGSTLVQFQKYPSRFGHGGELPEDIRNRRDLTVEDALALRKLCPTARAVSPERYLFGAAQGTKVKANGKEAQAPTIAGVWPDYMVANDHYVRDGRFVTDADVLHATSVAVVGLDVVAALYPNQDPLGRELELGSRRYTIVGVFEKKGSSFGGSNDDFVMVPLSSFDAQFPWVQRGGDSIHIATVPLSADRTQALVEEGTAVLRARRALRPDEPNDFYIHTAAAQLERTGKVLAWIGFVMVFIAAVALIVGGVGVMNIMTVAVTQRTREIGVRMALGARKHDIVLQFLSEAATLTGLGGIAGVAAGLGIVAAIRATGFIPANSPWWSIVAGLGVSVATGLFFGLYPAVKASRLDPIDALRYE